MISFLCLWIIKINLFIEKEVLIGFRIYLGGFFRGNIILCWVVCWGICNGGRGCFVLKGLRFLKDDES